MIELAWPFVLLLFPLPLILRAVMPSVAGKREGALKVHFFNEVLDLPYGVLARTAKGRWRMLTIWVVWLGLLFAAARPRWVGLPEEIQTHGRDLMMAVDISGSMAIKDFKLKSSPVERLEAVRKVAGEFIKRREGDRLGLIMFGTRPFLVCPLTFDRDTVHTILQDAQIGLAGPETAIGDAIGLAAKRLKDRPERSRVLILLTDGHNTTGNLVPIQALVLAKAIRMRVFTIGVAADKMVQLTKMGRQIVNPSIELDEEMLVKVANETGGKYFRARDTRELQKIYKIIDELEPSTGKTKYLRPVKELFFWPLSFSLILSFLIALSRFMPIIKISEQMKDG